MKIILQQTVQNLGNPGDVVEVADGYARNYLMPRGLAVQASRGAVRHVESLKAAHSKRTSKEREALEASVARFQEVALTVTAQAGEEGKLFGSVTAADLAEELTKNGLDVDKKDVRLEEPIRSVGTHTFKVHLGHEVEADLSVEVVAAE
jgi:large subunit ribosomal protein L9